MMADSASPKSRFCSQRGQSLVLCASLALMACGSPSKQSMPKESTVESDSSVRLELTGENCSLTSSSFEPGSDAKELVELTYRGKDSRKHDFELLRLVQLGHLKQAFLEGKILGSQEVADGKVAVIEGPVLPQYGIEARKTDEGFEIVYRAEALLNSWTKTLLFTEIAISYDDKKMPKRIRVQEKETGLFGKTRRSNCEL